MCTILLLAPISSSLLFAVGNNPMVTSKFPTKSKKHLLPRLLYLLPTFLYLFLFSHIPLPPALQSHNTSPDMMTAALARLIVVGTIILGLLSGFGAISNSWAYIPVLSRTRCCFQVPCILLHAEKACLCSEGVPTEQDIATAEFALQIGRAHV